jgi:hypothetical protein
MRNVNGYAYPELKNVPLKMTISSANITEKPTGAIYSEAEDVTRLINGSMNVTYTNSLSVDSNLKSADITGVTPGQYGEQSLVITVGNTSIEETLNVGAVAGGEGTKSDPYQIADKSHLETLRIGLGENYKLIADLTYTEEDFASEGAFYNDGQLWLPIGENYENVIGILCKTLILLLYVDL